MDNPETLATLGKQENGTQTKTHTQQLCVTALSTIFQLYRDVSFVGGGNRITQRKPPGCRKSLSSPIKRTICFK
jgi:hypothetical protein